MLYNVIDHEGRQRVGQLVKAAMAWNGLSGPAIQETGRISRASIDRIKRADPSVSNTVLRAMGDVLGMPRDYLLYVGEGNIDRIRESGADPDLVRWTLDLFHDPDPEGVEETPRVR